MMFLLDTNICIYLIKNKPEGLRRHLEPLRPGDVGISSITVAELRYGAAKSQAKEKNTAALDMFLAPFEIMQFDDRAADVYGAIRAGLEKNGTPVGPLDTLIAAQAISLAVTLVTNNMREFRRIPGLQCVNWHGHAR